MKILLVDDSATTRALLRRALGGVPAVEVAEAGNGLEALAEIARQRFDLVILDVNMPVMGGLETLETIRASPRHVALPVVVLTSDRNDDTVRRLVEVGITGYLSKPLAVDTLADRLSTVIAKLREPAVRRRPDLVAGQSLRVLLVEQDPDRRHFAATVLSSHHTVASADSAAAALQICLAPATKPFDVVLLGEEIGLPPAAVFLAKLRTSAPGQGVRSVEARFRPDADTDPGRDRVDGTFEWANVPDVFLARFERAALGDGMPVSGLALIRQTLEHDAVRATEQLFGLMLSSEVVLLGPGATPQRSWPGSGVHARIDLHAGGAPALSVLFRADGESARAATARLLGTTPAEVNDADVVATAGEFANIIVGRLRNRMFEAGIETRMQLPTTWIGEGAADVASAGMTLQFDLRELGATVGLVLQVSDATAA